MISAKSARIKKLFTVFFFLFLSLAGYCQRYLTDLDSSHFFKDTLRPFLKRFDNIRITGYMQPQFQVAEADGAQSFEGGNFAQFSRSRFMLRRARVKIEYLLTSTKKFSKSTFYIPDRRDRTWRDRKRYVYQVI
jgi:hypothetical protein